MKQSIILPSLAASLLMLAPMSAQASSKDAQLLNEVMYSQEKSADAKKKAIKDLIAKGVDMNAVDKAGGHPLIDVIMIDMKPADKVELIKIMVKAGADVNHQRKYPEGYGGDNGGEGGTALMKACMGNDDSSDVSGGDAHPTVIQALLDAGAKLELVDDSGSDALSCAIDSLSLERVKLLLAAGADAKYVDPESKATRLMGVSSWAHKPEHIAMAELLLSEGVDINAQNSEGNTALHYASEYADPDIAAGQAKYIEMLLKNGAKADIKNAEGVTAADLIKASHPSVKLQKK